MHWIFLCLSILFASLNSILLHKLPKNSSMFHFNMISSGVWLCLLFALNGFSLTLTPHVILWGLLYGVTQELFVFFKAQAMKNGSVSVTTLIGNCSLLLSTSVGILVWKESVSPMQIFGILLLLAAFVLSTYKKREKAENTTKRWLLYCCLFFSFAAGVGIIFKAFSKTNGADSAGDMMIFAAITMLIFSSLKLAVSKILSKAQPEKPALGKTFLAITLISGILSCGYNRLNIVLAGLFDSAVFYPCFNGGVILASAVLSRLLLREKLTKRQTIGLILGILAVVTVGVF